MKLKSLLKGIEGLEIKGSKEVEITGISDDSRIIAPGHLFIARPGSTFNGTEFIPQAIGSGAHAILTDLYDPFLKVTQLLAKRPGDFAALLASRYYGQASQDLFVVGTTGTKGKTTTTYMIHHLLEQLNLRSGLVSTVETIIGDERRASSLTTHSAIQNQKLLKEMLSRGCKAVSLEVSSHGLQQGRVDETHFDVAIFTNLYPDHLDYHLTMNEYACAKKRLFTHLDQSPKKKKRALFNADNPWCAFMREGCSSPVWTFGIQAPADIVASGISFDEEGTCFTVAFEGQRELFRLPLMGRFNVYNALGAIGVGLEYGASLCEIAAALQTFRAAPGRLERVPNDRGVWVFVDYAHTGEALENVLLTLREIARKRIICVFGCGGNRDPQRRTNTAKAAERYADVAIITSDNPRKEDPAAISEQIRLAFQDPLKPIVILDRTTAIYRALEMAEKEDIVLIAGKGHEKVQIFAHQTIAFDDVAVAKEALQKTNQSVIL